MTRPIPTTFRGHARALVTLGLPLVGSAVAGFAIHMTDVIMLGWYDVIALASATIATSFWFNLWILGAGFGNAVSPMVASAIAAGDETRARRVTRMAFWLSAGYALLMVPTLWWSEAVFLWIGQEPEVASLAQAYLRIAVWGMFPALAANVMRNYLGAQGLTAVQLWVTLGGVALNGLCNYALIFGNLGLPELGIRGAAIASIAVQTATLAVLVWYAEWRLPEVRLFQRLWRDDAEARRDVFRLGLPIGLTSLSEGGLFTASAVMMGWVGAVPLAAHGIALQLAALTFMFHVGMSQAATIRAGGAYGRRDETELRAVGRAAIVIGLGFGAVVVLTFLSIPETLVALFVDPAEPTRAQLIAIGGTLVLMAALFQFVDAGQIIALSLLRGVQDTAVPMWLAVVSYWLIGLPASYLFGFVFGMGAVGIWLGLTFGLGTAAATMMVRFWGRSVRIATPTG
ncbi:MATE family efflux transporter [Wenxinia marina]|uniref:Multidrug-efflux transporter n=1 Tax=Wenxinia marina DSM 24838 TaxID=1123501 RepID=A0A0D0Q9D9_9RHOB|nr:MATE family efflux transporter [Wenxinia marina]KIQ68987.1 putative efflux protein, MATE family [Wenxinia marina DSM 24838]GGL63553.1 MATE family efflux transporter [Wenxinia marina]